MLHRKSKKYIQVNIYGRTLQDLEREGIVLSSILSDIGCPNAWITEGLIYSEDEEEIEKVEGDEPIFSETSIAEKEPELSTTVANVKVPRCSTKKISHQNINCQNFTLNMTEKLSKICPNHEEEFNLECSLTSIQDVLNQIVQHVVDSVETQAVKNPLPLFNNTMASTHTPRHSTPIVSQMDPLHIFTLNIPEKLSGIHVVDDDEEIVRDSVELGAREHTGPVITEIIEHELNVEPEDVVFESGTSVRKRSSSLQSRNAELMQKRKWLGKRSLSKRFTVIETYEEDALSESFGHRENCDFDFSGYYDDREDQYHMMENDDKSKQTGVNLSNIHLVSEHDDAIALEVKRSGSERVYENLETVKPYSNRVTQFVSSNCLDEKEFGDQRPFTQLCNKMCSQNSSPFQNGDDTVIMNTETDHDVYFPPSPINSPAEKMFRTCDEISMNEGSFKIPTLKNTEKQKRLNQTHVIKCGFESCNKDIHWKIRYGKRRLLDHALNHHENKWIGCRNCAFSCQTTSQMKYHYKKQHIGVKMTGFGMKSIDYDERLVAELWEECFGAQKNLVGSVGRIFRKLNHPKIEIDEPEDTKADLKEKINIQHNFNRIQ